MINFPIKYKIIYADPPYYFKTFSKKGEDRSPINHYNCMTIKDICNLKFKNLFDKDCILFIWAIDPMLPETLQIIKAWGFIYKTVAFTWIKENKKSDGYFTGLGYWTRANPEMCLLATKGKPKRISKSVKQLIIDKRREHSRKPDCVRDRIVELCGDLPRIELFARQTVKGWANFGNEINKYD
tara:strand:+ start:133 stop:681 length:549 start_codon:yes stop_codon:yes gene_type:complete